MCGRQLKVVQAKTQEESKKILNSKGFEPLLLSETVLKTAADYEILVSAKWLLAGTTLTLRPLKSAYVSREGK